MDTNLFLFKSSLEEAITELEFSRDLISALSLRDMVQGNSTKFNYNAKKSRVFGIRPRKNLRRFVFFVKSKESYSDPKGHIVSILYPKSTLDELTSQTRKMTTTNTPCHVHCTCPAFQYWGCAYNVTKEKSIMRGKAETRSPDIRDPNGENMICKHLVRVSKNINRMSFKRLHAKFKDSHQKKVEGKGRVKKSSLYDEVIHTASRFEDHPELYLSEDLSNIEEFLEDRGLVVCP